MRQFLLLLLPILFLAAACAPSQKVTSAWVNQEALPTVKRPYHSILVLALTENPNAKSTIEEQMLKLIKSRGQKALKSSDIFIPKMDDNSEASRNLINLAIRKSGCEAVFTIALLDVKKEEYYQPGSAYYPMNYGYYGNFSSYYGYHYPIMYDPGYYVTDKTYFLESNFYDMASGQLLYSVQSSAYNPASLDTWFRDYSRMLLNQLKADKIVTK
jgi:hypothetical protein